MEYKSDKYSILNNCEWILQLFLFILVFYLFKKNIQLGLIVCLIIITYYNYNCEAFTKNLSIDQLIDSINVNKLNYNTIYIPLDIDERVYQITKLALKDNKLRKIIDNKIIEIYGEIKNNEKLNIYLKFMNLINDNGLPSFINECDEVLLSNKIKIILVTLPN
jgi:hypothetical protein